MNTWLVDTSAWVAFLRGDTAAVRRVDPLLAERSVAICGAVYAELLSGAVNHELLGRLRLTLRSLNWLPEPPDVWDRIADTRFALARQGYQASLVDVMVAISAAESGTGLLTRDRDFEYIGRVLPALSVEIF